MGKLFEGLMGDPLPIINSIQRGSITLTAGETTEIATINSVNTTACIVLYGGITNSWNAESNFYRGLINLEITDSTTVTATRQNGTASSATVSWQVVEFSTSGIRSIQSGTIIVASGTVTNTGSLSPEVDTSKAILFYNGHFSDYGTPNAQMGQVELTDSATVTVNRAANATSGSVTLKWSLIEFIE